MQNWMDFGSVLNYFSCPVSLCSQACLVQPFCEVTTVFAIVLKVKKPIGQLSKVTQNEAKGVEPEGVLFPWYSIIIYSEVYISSQSNTLSPAE